MWKYESLFIFLLLRANKFIQNLKQKTEMKTVQYLFEPKRVDGGVERPPEV